MSYANISTYANSTFSRVSWNITEETTELASRKHSLETQSLPIHMNRILHFPSVWAVVHLYTQFLSVFINKNIENGEIDFTKEE